MTMKKEIVMKQPLEYAAINCKEQMAKENPGASWDCTDVLNAFKAGAEWVAKQGVSYETELGWEIDGDRAFPELDPPVEDLLMPSDISLNFNDGDKVIVQIRKI